MSELLFNRSITISMRYRISDDVKDGSGKGSGSCREYVLLRARPDSVVKFRN